MKQSVIDMTSFGPTVRKLWEMMNPCTICPRNCRINRSQGQIGYCGIGDFPVISSQGPHFGEESMLVGKGGSGTIFFAGCNLGCVFCQNYDISHFRHGEPVTILELAEFMIDLQSYGCSNINFVTPTHVVPAIAGAIEIARANGLKLPTVYNCGGYESVETLKLLEGYFDIYMPDMKFSDSFSAKEFAGAPDYPEVSFAAIEEMQRQVGDLELQNGIAIKGLLVRHLVMPNNVAGSFEIIDYLVQNVSPYTAINIMEQYRPCFKAEEHPRINRLPTLSEIEQVRQYAFDKGLRLIN